MRIILLLFLFLNLSSCFTQEKNVEGPLASDLHSFTIMTFNVENLFDTKDDPQKNDETYLPSLLKNSSSHKDKCKKIKRSHWRRQCLHWNWSKEALTIKMKRIAQVIQAVNKGLGPDIVIMQEVENIHVLNEMNKKYLPTMNYKHVILIEGQDSRGIDNAILSRLPLISKAQLTPIPFSHSKKSGGKTDSRGILEASFSLGEEKITILANHFPAPFHHRNSREDGFLMLKNFAQKNEHLTIAAGDFNLTSHEDRSHHVLKRLVTPFWKVSHLEGCKNCKGSAYYKRNNSWSFLDMILVAKKGLKNSKWKINKHSIQVFHPLNFQNKKKAPWRFTMPEKTGMSDHWPVIMTLQKALN